MYRLKPMIKELTPEVVRDVVTLLGNLVNKEGQVGGEYTRCACGVLFELLDKLGVALGLLANKI